MPPFLNISFHPQGTLTLLLPVREVPLLPRTSLLSPRHLKSPHGRRRCYSLGLLYIFPGHPKSPHQGDTTTPQDYLTFPTLTILDLLGSHSSSCINSSLESKDVEFFSLWSNLLNFNLQLNKLPTIIFPRHKNIHSSLLICKYQLLIIPSWLFI